MKNWWYCCGKSYSTQFVGNGLCTGHNLRRLVVALIWFLWSFLFDQGRQSSVQNLTSNEQTDEVFRCRPDMAPEPRLFVNFVFEKFANNFLCSRTGFSRTFSRRTQNMSNNYRDKQISNWRTCSRTSRAFPPCSRTCSRTSRFCNKQILLITCSEYTLCVTIFIMIIFHCLFEVTHD